MQEFFSRKEVLTDIKDLITKLNGRKEDQESTKASRIRDLLRIIVANTDQFDSLCQVNIRWIGEAFTQKLSTYLTEEITTETLDEVYGTLFRFVTEFDLSLHGDMSFDLRRFVNYVDDEPAAFSERAMLDIQFARQQMPIAILKELVGSSVLKNISSPQKIVDSVDAKIAAWSKELDTKEQAATRLKDALKQYTAAFNFVGLHQGFDNLSTDKKREVETLNRQLVLFGLLAIAPLAGELVAAAFALDRFAEWSTSMLIAAVPAFSMTLLLVYFFRIVLRRAEAARSQLLQIELRKTLCQFIQSYADYAKEIRSNNPEALVKFENMIFSGIVSTEDKLPTTFDGVEQLSQLIQSLRGPR
jgi:hypothetical protein